MQEYKHQYMIGTEYGGGRSQTLKFSCPLGMTDEDLRKLFPTNTELSKFLHWMRGQTMSICDGSSYHHIRVHNESCRKPYDIGIESMKDEAHTDESDFNWRCGYDGGYEEDTQCKDNPHGVITYPWDVERYLRGLPVID